MILIKYPIFFFEFGFWLAADSRIEISKMATPWCQNVEFKMLVLRKDNTGIHNLIDRLKGSKGNGHKTRMTRCLN